MLGERRSSFEIIYNILCESRAGINKTRLVYKTNLNFHVMERYLELLTSRGLLILEPKNRYKTSDSGLKYIMLFEQITRELLKIDDVCTLEL